jgi:cobyric acid synthase
LHGLFHNDRFRHAWLRSLGWEQHGDTLPASAKRSSAYDRLADALECSLDMARLDAILNGVSGGS